jgi:hypothetical protein
MALIPSDDKITIDGEDKPLIRISFEFDDSIEEDVQRAFILTFGAMVADAF